MSKRAELKVYGWMGWRNESVAAPNGNHQTREVVAARSVAEVRRLTGISRSQFNNYGCETGNAAEIEVALSAPGTVFWTELDNRRGPWRKAASSVGKDADNA